MSDVLLSNRIAAAVRRPRNESGTSPAEASLYRLGVRVVSITTTLVVLFTGPDIENLALLAIVLASFRLVRKSGVEIPFLIVTTHLLVSTVYASMLLKAGTIELPEHYSALFGKPQVLWLALYPFFVAVGIRIATSLSSRGKAMEVRVPQIPFAILFTIWATSTAITIVVPDFDNPLIRILVQHVVPLLSLAVAIRSRHPVFVFGIIAISLVPPVMTTYRHIVGEYVLIYALAYLILMRRSAVLAKWAVPLFLVGALSGAVAFYLMTFLKYGDYPQDHLFVRGMLIQAHSSLSIKNAVDSGKAFTQREQENMGRYWLGLIPFAGKPINAGHFTYEMSRDASIGHSGSEPYLPPAAPAELYMTGGWPHLIAGGLIHGLLIAFFWKLAKRCASSAIQLSGFVGIVVMLSGIGGGIDLYGRLEAAKWSIFVLTAFWMLTPFFHDGRLLKYSVAGKAYSR